MHLFTPRTTEELICNYYRRFKRSLMLQKEKPCIKKEKKNSPTSCFIWNNKNICYKHKSLIFENWFKNEINRVSPLFHQNGYLFSYQEFLSHYNFPVTPKQFATVFGAIPNGVIILFKGYNSALTSSEMPLPDTVDRSVGGICFLL